MTAVVDIAEAAAEITRDTNELIATETLNSEEKDLCVVLGVKETIDLPENSGQLSSSEGIVTTNLLCSILQGMVMALLDTTSSEEMTEDLHPVVHHEVAT